MALSKPQIEENYPEIQKHLENPCVNNNERWKLLQEKICKQFVFAEPCPCQLCHEDLTYKPFHKASTPPPSDVSTFKPPNIYCMNLHHWKANYVPCCCQHFCDVKTDWTDVDQCRCPRCCSCQKMTSEFSLCSTCKDKDRVFTYCKHLKMEHSPCLFYDKIIQIVRNESEIVDDYDSDDSVRFAYEDSYSPKNENVPTPVVSKVDPLPEVKSDVPSKSVNTCNGKDLGRHFTHRDTCPCKRASNH